MAHFTGMRVWRASFGLRLKFSHARAERERVETLLVAVSCSNGGVGFGQALPREYLTGETAATALEDIRSRWWPALTALRLEDDASFADAVEALAPLFTAADAERKNASYAAVDVAALSAFAAGAGVPCRGEIGSATVPVGNMPLVGVLSAASPAKAAWMARLLKGLGYARFKVKVGKDALADTARLAAVRRVVGADAWLAVDANGVWEYDEALERLRGLRRFAIALVEEPLAPAIAAETDFSALEKLSGFPLMVDESLCTIMDAESLLRRGTPSWWNLRLAKNGGFAGWRRFSRLAAQHGITVYGGILVGETAALAAAARAAWFSAGGPVCGEYGFPRIFLRGDPFRGGPGGFFGVMAPPRPEMTGLGLSLREKTLMKNAELLWREGE